MAQMGFFDLSDLSASLDAKRDPLVEVDAIVPTKGYRPALERVWRKPDAERKSRAERKPMDAVVQCFCRSLCGWLPRGKGFVWLWHLVGRGHV